MIRQWLVIVGMAGLTALATGCMRQQTAVNAEPASLRSQEPLILGAGDQMGWQVFNAQYPQYAARKQLQQALSDAEE